MIILSLSLLASSASSRCLPHFPFQQGWLGTNSAYSLPFEHNKTLWLFGDTFIGAPGQKTRVGAKLIPNSIGVLECQGSKGVMTYYWGHVKDNAAAYFPSTEKDVRLWPLDGFLYGGKLYVFLAQILDKPDPRDYEYIGVTLARIENPNLVPEAWDINYFEVLKSTRFFPGVSAVVSGEHVYLFTAIQDDLNKDHPIVLTRLALDKLKKPAENLEYYSKEKIWKKGTDLRAALTVMDSGGLAMSVRLHPELKKWVAVHTRPGAPASGVVMRISGSLEGPWTEATPIYSVPEKNKANRSYDPEMFCSMAVEHPQYETKSHLYLSYVCNYTQFQKVKYDNNVFVPRTVSLQLHSRKK